MCPTTSSAASARSRQNSMALAISPLLGVSSSSSTSSFCRCLFTEERHSSRGSRPEVSLCLYLRLTQFGAALSSPPPQWTHPRPRLLPRHPSACSCLGQGVSKRSLHGTYGNRWSSIRSETPPVVEMKVDRMPRNHS